MCMTHKIPTYHGFQHKGTNKPFVFKFALYLLATRFLSVLVVPRRKTYKVLGQIQSTPPFNRLPT